MVSGGNVQRMSEAHVTGGVAAWHGKDKAITALMPSTKRENVLQIAVENGVDSKVVVVPQVLLTAGSPWSPFDELNPCVGAARILASACIQFVFQPRLGNCLPVQ